MNHYFKYLLLFIVSVYCSGSMIGQDTLFTINGEKQTVFVKEKSDSLIKYTLSPSIEEVLFSIGTEDIIKIIYINGQTEIYNGPSKDKISIIPESTEYKKNFASINLADLMFGSVTFDYERVSKSGYFSIKIPISIGYKVLGFNIPNEIRHSVSYDYINGYYNPGKYYSTGLELLYYPFNQEEVSYYFGPAIEFGELENSIYDYDGILYTQFGRFFSVLLENGLTFNSKVNITGSINFGLGFSQTYSENYFHPINQNMIVFRGGISLGYKF